MVSDWEAFARGDAEGFIATELKNVAVGDRDRSFWESGAVTAETILDLADLSVPPRQVLEIGAGVGRILLSFPGTPGSVVGVDVSKTMRAKMVENAALRGVSNAVALAPEDSWPKESVDLIYSWIVFQHLENLGEIGAYCGRVCAALSIKGKAVLQFDTRRRGVLYQFRSFLPDWALPLTWRRSLRRVRRDPADIRGMLYATGLVLEAEYWPGTELHTFVLSRGEREPEGAAEGAT